MKAPPTARRVPDGTYLMLYHAGNDATLAMGRRVIFLRAAPLDMGYECLMNTILMNAR
jgi:hypothetical protein